MKLLIICGLIAISQALTFGKTNIVRSEQLVPEVVVQPEPISPYAFSYTADAIDGSSARQESADASGVVRGSYSIVSADGIKRIVNYIADENGFRAQVQTNEPGTESKSSADVIMQSSQLPAEEIALKYGSQPVITQNPQVLSLGVKGVQPLLLNRPVFEPTLIKSRPLEIPVAKNILHTQHISTLQTPTKFETPIKLLTRIPKINTLRADIKPLSLDLQQKEDLIPQSFETF